MNLPMFETAPVSNLTSAYILQQLTVFNWGPFADVHRAELDPQGTAIIGATGSGKTTLIAA
jgi:DNA repair exonuclease SbcCD ATPase subunit